MEVWIYVLIITVASYAAGTLLVLFDKIFTSGVDDGIVDLSGQGRDKHGN